MLVAMVVLFFLQDWKAMILPMIDVPVSLIGTFAVMAVLGFSLNNLTLFGLVLAIGIVVDDAIVVLENIERLIATGLDARAATIKAMDEITGPIIAITLVLSCRVPARRLFIAGHHRPVLPPVRRDDCRLDDHFGHQCHDADARRGRSSSSKPKKSSRVKRRSRQALPSRNAARSAALVDFRGRRRLLALLAGVRMLWLSRRRPESSWRASRGLLGRTWACSSPACSIGGVLGWFIIRPVNRVLPGFSASSTAFFDWLTACLWPGVSARCCA